ncbi:DUF3718 domain-containing protein [Corallincola holothuriorum]|uniref:DUF3718 domain-containing protein n=1 Tax=Corallincola holothuriorum TaxID=2282215 RepID=A0A368NQN1_9GAMM|nr:DUF3718 domain-containing protein [Corallincola holothuriorum]RCU51581.1 DUF3718 domain-containing protein [Corallincola holothuriorum]
MIQGRISAILLAITCLLLSSKAIALDIKAAESLCHAIAKDDTVKVKKTLRKQRVKLKRIYQDVMCNGRSLLKFALERSANEVGQYLVEQLPDKMLNDAGPDGYMVLSWGEHNGYEASPILKAIRQRI